MYVEDVWQYGIGCKLEKTYYIDALLIINVCKDVMVKGIQASSTLLSLVDGWNKRMGA